MKSAYTAIIQRSGSWWIGRIEEIPGVKSQGETRGELIENLRSALKEALEMNRAEALAAATGQYEEMSLEVENLGVAYKPSRDNVFIKDEPMAYLLEMYERYVKPLEEKHWGKFVTVASDGELFMGDSYQETRDLAKSQGKEDCCSFKVGVVAVEKLRW